MRVHRRALDWLRENERILAICGSTVLVMAGQGITAPILPLYADSFGVSTATVGLTISAFALARLVLNLPAGQIADRRGRRILLVSGPLVSAVGMVGSGLAVGIADLLAWRFVAGAGSALYMTGAQLYILDVSPPDRRATNISWNAGALLAGVSIGPAVGGLVAEVAGLRAPFLLVGVTSLAAAAYSYLRLPERRAPAATPTDGDTEASDPTTDRGRWPAFATIGFVSVSVLSTAMFAARAGGRATLVPLLAVDEFDLSEGQLGGILGLTAVATLALVGPVGRAADHHGRKRVIVPVSLLASAGLVLIAVAPSVLWLTVALLVLALGSSLAGPAQYAYLADTIDESQRGRAIALYRSAGDIGFLAAPPLIGFLADATSIGAALTVNAALVAAATGWFAWRAPEPARGHRSAPRPAVVGP